MSVKPKFTKTLQRRLSKAIRPYYDDDAIWPTYSVYGTVEGQLYRLAGLQTLPESRKWLADWLKKSPMDSPGYICRTYNKMNPVVEILQ